MPSRRRFRKCPNCGYEEESRRQSDRIVDWLTNRANAEGVVRTSALAIACSLDMPKETVLSALRRFEKSGLIKWTRGARGALGRVEILGWETEQ